MIAGLPTEHGDQVRQGPGRLCQRDADGVAAVDESAPPFTRESYWVAAIFKVSRPSSGALETTSALEANVTPDRPAALVPPDGSAERSQPYGTAYSGSSAGPMAARSSRAGGRLSSAVPENGIIAHRRKSRILRPS